MNNQIHIAMTRFNSCALVASIKYVCMSVWVCMCNIDIVYMSVTLFVCMRLVDIYLIFYFFFLNVTKNYLRSNVRFLHYVQNKNVVTNLESYWPIQLCTAIYAYNSNFSNVCNRWAHERSFTLITRYRYFSKVKSCNIQLKYDSSIIHLRHKCAFIVTLHDDFQSFTDRFIYKWVDQSINVYLFSLQFHWHELRNEQILFSYFFKKFKEIYEDVMEFRLFQFGQLISFNSTMAVVH